MMIDLIEKGIHKYLSVNHMHREDIEIYIHPIVKGYLEREIHTSFLYYDRHLNGDISILGVRTVKGYDSKSIVIAAHERYNYEPLIIKIC